MTNDNFMRLMVTLSLVNHIYEQLSVVANDESDGRFNSMVTQTFTLKQDIEDKIREDMVDSPITIGNAPNLPNSTSQNQPTQSTGNSIPMSNPSSNGGNIQPNGNMNGNQPTNNGTNFNQPNGNIQTPPLSNDAANFFNDLLSGKLGNNSDLNDILNQINQNQNNSSNDASSNLPF